MGLDRDYVIYRTLRGIGKMVRGIVAVAVGIFVTVPMGLTAIGLFDIELRERLLEMDSILKVYVVTVGLIMWLIVLAFAVDEVLGHARRWMRAYETRRT